LETNLTQCFLFGDLDSLASFTSLASKSHLTATDTSQRNRIIFFLLRSDQFVAVQASAFNTMVVKNKPTNFQFNGQARGRQILARRGNKNLFSLAGIDQMHLFEG